MAPVDPTDLLKAFKPLLTVLGGIKSIEGVPRLSQLMKRYSKKLVSRCVYCNMLLRTTPDVLQCFLETEGWNLINTWLKDSLNGNNEYVCELLDLLLKCPMNVTRLKLNDTPKLVKSLTKNPDKDVSDKAKLVVDKWTALISTNENINNGNLASRKKRKKEKSADDDNGDTAKIRKVKGAEGGILQQQVSVNDSNNSTDDATAKSITTASKITEEATPTKSSTVAYKTTEEESTTTESGSNVNRPRTAKVSYGKSRSLGILEESNVNSGKSKGSNKKGDDNSDKSGLGNKSNKLNNKTTDNNSVPVPSGGQPAHSKTNATPKQSSKPTLKESVGFIEDIVSLSSFTGQVRKRRKSDSKSKSSTTSGSNTAKDSAPDNSSQGDESGTVQEPMDTNGDTSDEMEEERITSASGDDSNSNTNNIDDRNKLPIVDVPELDNLVIPEIDPSKLPGTIKSILSFGKKTGRAKKSVRWRSDERIKEIKFFELDETERTNVSKSNFGDFRANDIRNERQMLQQLRSNRGIPGAPSSATMTPSTEKCITYLPWKLTLIDLPPGLPLIESGAQSEEKRIQAAASSNLLNADFFPVKEGSHEYYPKEPDSMEPAGERNDGPTVIPLEDENFTMTDYSTHPPPQPRTGEAYPLNRGVPGPPIPGPGPYPHPGMGARTPGPPVNRPFVPPGFVTPVSYPSFGPGSGPFVPPGGPRMMPSRPMPGGPMPGMSGFQPPGLGAGPGGWPPRPRPPPVCRYFLKSGSCRFMARCNYLHQYPNTNAPHGPGSSSGQSHME